MEAQISAPQNRDFMTSYGDGIRSINLFFTLHWGYGYLALLVSEYLKTSQ